MKSNNQSKEDNGVKVKVPPKIRKHSLAPPGINLDEKSLFDSTLIETNANQFNIVQPDVSQNDSILRYKNPKLLAIGNKAKVSKSYTKSSKSSIGSRQNLAPIGQGITSLLSNKPLADLPKPPMESIEEVKNREEAERLSIDFREDPVAYFSKRKDGRGHLFIYMKYAKDKDDPDFSPYELTKIPYSEVKRNYFTMSANGVTHVDVEGNTEHISLDTWAREESIFKSIRKLRIFQNFRIWKPLRLWRCFIMKQRFNEILDKVIDHPTYYNASFPSVSIAFSVFKEKLNGIIMSKLLCLYPTKKYEIAEFAKVCEMNLSSLVEEYGDFISDVSVIINHLNKLISDPHLLKVRDNEFDEIRRKNPNISQLVVLERKKDAERIRRKEQMSSEIAFIANYLRMIDYMLLESLRESCFKAFQNAEKNCMQEQSAIFQVDLFFTENGEVSFKPSIEILTEEVSKQLKNAFKTMEELPRLLKSTSVRQILRNMPNLNIPLLFDEGPDFQTMTSFSTLVQEVETHIIKIINDAFKDSLNYAEIFKDFYPLYNLGKTWNARNLIITENGEVYKGPLSLSDRLSTDKDDEFLFHPERAPIIDFPSLKKLINNLNFETERVGTIKAGNTRGILHIDSRNLKSILTPIPMKSLSDIYLMLKDLMNFKVETLEHVFKNYIMRLKAEPTTLQGFVDFCDLLTKTSDLIPQMRKEIIFIDELISLISKMGYQTIQNNLYNPFRVFQAEQENAAAIRDANTERFEFLLSQLLKQQVRKVNKYKDRSINNIPTSLHETNCDAFAKKTNTLKMKVEKFRPIIQDSIRYQEILNSKTTDFPEMAEIDSNIEFTEKLIQTTRIWESLYTRIKDEPFALVDMNQFIEDSKKLGNEIENIRETIKKPSPFLSELSVNLLEFEPFLEQLSQLSFGRMQPRHWAQLFIECGQEYSYNSNITIQQLLSLGILSNKEIIKEITITSQGESQLETEFSKLKTHWDEVEIPIDEDFPESDDDIRLGNLDLLFNDIENTSVQLNSMMMNRFVNGIYDNVYSLAQNLNNIVEILDKWQKFEKNWDVISNLKKKTEIFELLVNQQPSFEIIEEKWKGIVEHVRSNKKLFQACSYPTLLDDLIESNNLLEIIFESLSEFVEKKRESIPRLYFLSNDEVINIFSTSDFNLLTTEIVKMMMHISSFDAHSEKTSIMPSEANSDFPDLKVHGLIGEDGDTLPFVDIISCSGQVDEWITKMFATMKESTKEAVAVSLSLFSSVSLNEWIMSVTSYIAVLTLYVSFTRDVEDCFNNLEANPKGFSIYHNNLRQKINDLINLMTTPLSLSELGKVSTILTNVISFFEKAKLLCDRLKDSSASQMWHDMLKFKYDTSSMDITILFGDNKWNHCHEYWGKIPAMMMTPTVEHALLNMCQARVYDQIPLIFGPFGCGKTELIRTFAYYLGNFVFSAASFPSFSYYYYSCVLKGAALSGSWILFSEIEQLSSQSLTFLFDLVRVMNDSLVTNMPINNVYLKFSQLKSSTRIFLTSSINSFVDEKLPPQLRSYIRPISLCSPLVKRIVETKLITHGFLSSKEISEQLEAFVTAVIPIFNLTHSKLQYCLKIASAAQDLLRQLMHANKVSFINYYEDSRTAEHFSIARSAFDQLQSVIDQRNYSLLIKILYQHFRIFESFIKFQKCIMNPCNFFLDKISTVIADVIENESQSMGIEFPINYLIEKCFFLFQMMLTSNCIIICGPPNSGKTLVIKLMEKVFASMFSDADIINHFRGIRPWKVCTIYQNSNSWDKVFGYAFQDEIQNTKWRYGMFQTALTKLNAYQHTHHRILKFDGEMTNKFSKFLYQFISEDAKFRINSLGSFPANSTFHCFIETENISNVSPEILSVCGILSMKSLQIKNGIFNVMKFASLPYPSFPFANVSKKFKEKFTQKEIHSLFDIFCEIAPKIISQVVKIPCLIDLLQISDNYAEKAAIYGIQYILNSKMDVLENTESARFLMIRAFFDIFSAIIESDQIEGFESWLCEKFKLSLPKDWSDFEVTDQFIESFPHPSLSTCQIIDKEKVGPIDHSILSSRVLVHFEEGGTMPMFIDDFVIPNPTFLKPSIIFETSIQTHSHILLFGPSFSGKSSILSFMLQNSSDVFSVEISLTPLLSTDDIIEIIRTQTNLIRKVKINLEKPKLFALVFSNIDSANSSVLEFIRQLMATKQIQLFSQVDPKMLDEVQVDDFIVIIKATNISNIPSRFISHFTPIQLLEYPTSIKMYICKKAMNAFGINSDLIEIMNIIINLLNISLSKILEIIVCISHLPQRAAASDEDKITVFQVIFSEIYFICFNCNNEKFDEFLKQAKLEIEKHNFGGAQMKFEEDRIFAVVNYHFTNKIGKFNPRIIKLNDEIMKKKLSDFMHSNISELTLSNFIKLSVSLLKLGNNCIISSITGSARIAMCKLFSFVFGFNFVDLSEELKTTFLTTVKKHVKTAITDNKTQLFVMRVNDNNINEYNLLCSALGHLNICHLFSIDEIDSLIQKVDQTDEKVDINKRREWINKFKFMVRCKCRLVIAKDCEIQEDSKIFDEVRISSPTRESICENFIDDQKLRGLFISIWERIDKFLPIHHVNQFYDFVNTYLKFIESPLFESNLDVSVTLDFIDRLSKERGVYVESLNSLQPELDSLKQKFDEKKIEIDSILEKFENDRSELNEEKNLKEMDLLKKKQELFEVQESLNKDGPLINEAIEEIKKLTDNDVEPIRLSKVSSFPSLRMILEILCILTGISKNKTEEMLQNPQFPQSIIEIKPERITYEMIGQIKEYLAQEELQKESMESVAPILSTILQFIQALFDFGSHRFHSNSILTEIEVRQNDLNDFMQKMKEEQNRIKEEEKKSKPKFDEYKAMELNLEKVQKNFDSILSQKEKIDQILNGIDKIIEKLKNYNEKFINCTDKKRGDSILLALYLSYCGVCNVETRKEIIENATEELAKANILTSFKSPYEEITAKLTKKATVTIASIELPHEILTEIEHIFNAPQPPLLIDPDGVIINSFLNANKAYITSVNSHGFESALCESMKEGKTLFVTDVDCLHQRMSVIQRLLRKSGEITVNNSKFVCHQNFRPIYVTNITEPDQIPIELLTRTTVINAYSSCLKFAQNSIKKVFVNHFEPIHASTLSDISKAETAKSLTIIQSENEVTQLIHKMASNRQKNDKYSYLDDNETIELLNAAKARYEDSLHLIETAEKSSKSMEEAIDSVRPIITLCSTMWFCLSRYMPKVQPFYRFSFSQFQKTISTSLHSFATLRTGKLSEQQSRDIRKGLLDSVLQSLYPSFSLRDSVFFMFLTAFLAQNRTLDELMEIIENLIDKANSKYLSGAEKEVKKDADLIEKLKSVDFSHFFDLAMTFVLQFFGDDLMNNFPVFKIENIIGQTPTMPSMIITEDPNDDATNLIISFVISKLKMDNFVNFSLSDDPMILNNTIDGIKTAMSRGSWVLLHYWKPSLKSAEVINELLFQLHSCSFHSNFRLILNLHTTAFISPYLIMKCNKLMIDNYPSIKQTMKLSYDHFGNQQHQKKSVSDSSSLLLKRVFYFSTLVIGLVNFRSFLKPVGFKLFNGSHITSLREIIDYMKPFIESTKLADFPMRNLRDFVQEIAIGSKVIETQDRRSLRAILSSIYRMSMISDSNFTFLEQGSNEGQIWIPNNESSLLVMYQNQQRLMPLFQTTDVIMAMRQTSMPLLRWSMSRFVSKPFLSILDLNENSIGESEVESEVDRKFTQIEAALPSIIIFDEDDNRNDELEMDVDTSPLLLFWITEIDFLNTVLKKISDDVKKREKGIISDILNDRVPSSWKKVSHLPTIKNLMPFLIFLGEKRKFLFECLDEPFVSKIDIRLIDNVKGFFAAYQHEFAFEEGIDANGLMFEFTVPNPNKKQQKGLQLSGLVAVNGKFDGDRLVPLDSDEFNCFSQVPTLRVSLSNMVLLRKSSSFVCPIYKFLFMDEKKDETCTTMYDGETQNFVMDILLKTERGDRFWLLNGTALYCHVPPNFV